MRADRLWAALLVSAALAGCGAEGIQGPPAAAQVVARVNGTEITMQHVAAANRSTRPGNPAQALEKIIERELLVQKALEAKLERDPLVAQALDDARRQVLAQAWLERAAAAAAKSGADEVREFYLENPALFAERRVYTLRELTVPGGGDALEVVRAEAAAAKDLDEAAERLRRRELPAGEARIATQPAEQIPLAYLPQLAQLDAGGLAVFAAGKDATLIEVVAAQAAPFSEAQAAPLISQFLSGRRRLELAASEVKRLRGTASIEYVGDIGR